MTELAEALSSVLIRFQHLAVSVSKARYLCVGLTSTDARSLHDLRNLQATLGALSAAADHVTPFLASVDRHSEAHQKVLFLRASGAILDHVEKSRAHLHSAMQLSRRFNKSTAAADLLNALTDSASLAADLHDRIKSAITAARRNEPAK